VAQPDSRSPRFDNIGTKTGMELCGGRLSGLYGRWDRNLKTEIPDHFLDQTNRNSKGPIMMGNENVDLAPAVRSQSGLV